MNNCLNCGKEVIQTPGKKEKKYCDAKCKQQYWHKLKADKKDMVKISREEYERLIAVDTYILSFRNPSEEKVLKLTAKKHIKVTGKPVVIELNKEGSKPYQPKEENPRFKIVNGKRVFIK